jgi:cytochrome P450
MLIHREHGSYSERATSAYCLFTSNELSLIPHDKQIIGDDADHARFRKSLSHAFSEKSLRSQENLIKHYIDMLMRKLKVVASYGDKTDM